jgi:hypothetical protein
LGGPGAEQVTRELLTEIERECQKLQLPVELVQTIKDKLDFGSPPALLAFQGQFSLLRETIERSLQDRLFLYMPPLDASRYKEPLAWFVKTDAQFPSARDDIVGACRCYALEQPNACVFHCMGVLQYGLHSLAKQVGVRFDYEFALESWGPILSQIESKLVALRKEKKTEERDRQLNFYSEAFVQFRYFKDAWRNYVMHAREKYDATQAFTVLSHVRDFMEHLSS